MNIRNFVCSLLFLFTLCLSTNLWAIGTIELKDLEGEQITEKITELSQQLSSSENNAQVKQDLTQIIELLKKYEKQRKSYQEIKEAVTNQSQIIEQYKKQQKELDQKTLKISKEEDRINNLNIEEINKELLKIQALQLESQKNYNEQKNYSDMLFATTEYVQSKSLSLQNQIERDQAKIEKGNLRQTEEDYYYLDIQVNRYTIEYYQYVNSSHSVLQDLISTILTFYKLQLDYDNRLISVYQNRLNYLNREQNLKEHIKLQEEFPEIELTELTNSTSATALSHENTNYKNILNTTAGNITSYQQELSKLDQITDQISKIETNINKQIENFAGSLYLSQTLNKQLFEIPSYSSSTNYDALISNLRFETYEITNKLNNLQQDTKYKRKLKRTYNETWTNDQELAVDELLEQQKKLINIYQNKITEELSVLINIQVKQDQYEKTKQNIKNTINKQLFWLQSNTQINLAWFKNFFNIAKRELSDTSFSYDTHNLLSEIKNNIVTLLGLLIISLIIIAKQKNITQLINQYNKKAAKLKTDNHFTVIWASVLTAIRSLNWPIWSFILGLILSYSHIKFGIYDLGLIIKFNNIRLAGIIWILAFSYNAYKDNSINKIHFKREFDKDLQHYHMYFLGLLAFLSLLCSCKLHYLESLPTDLIGELVFILTLFALDFILLKHFILTISSPHKTVVTKFIALFYLLIPLVLIFCIGIGYFYSVLRVTERIIETFFVLFITDYIYEIFKKSLKLARYRLNYARKQKEAQLKLEARRAAATQQGNTISDEFDQIIIDDDELSVEEISKQTQSIFKLIYYTINILILYFMWSDVLGVMSYLDTINLWQVTGVDADGKTTIISYTSVSNVLLAIYFLILMVILVKNIPGILEVILNKFTNAKNASYSIKTILTYIIITVCTSISLSELGVTWDNLQWLVAALSVGLGFGLQEIFGNFVSGLILLFEQPIRLGDIVTIGSVSGRVTKIRIRATTILQFDSKELIVPNKTFITQSLTNWTLSDTMTRIEINVGVGYSEDLEVVRNALLEVADQCPYVMKEPSPKVYFFTFGDSNLNHTLYVYVKNIADRYPTQNYINTAIYNKFKELNIEIAFNQIDMYIKNVADGQEIKISNEKLEDHKGS